MIDYLHVILISTPDHKPKKTKFEWKEDLGYLPVMHYNCDRVNSHLTKGLYHSPWVCVLSLYAKRLVSINDYRRGCLRESSAHTALLLLERMRLEFILLADQGCPRFIINEIPE